MCSTRSSAVLVFCMYAMYTYMGVCVYRYMLSYVNVVPLCFCLCRQTFCLHMFVYLFVYLPGCVCVCEGVFLYPQSCIRFCTYVLLVAEGENCCMPLWYIHVIRHEEILYISTYEIRPHISCCKGSLASFLVVAEQWTLLPKVCSIYNLFVGYYWEKIPFRFTEQV